MRRTRGLWWVALLVAAGGLLAGCVPPEPPPPPPPPEVIDPPLPPAPPPQHRTDQIVFVGAGGIWTMHSDATEVHQLTHDGGIQPEVSRDGQKIAYTRAFPMPDTPSQNYRRIWVMNADGSDQHEVFSVPFIDPNKPEPLTGFWDSSPTWSPDGSQIAFIREDGALVPDGIMVMNADGSGGRLVVDAHEPRISGLAWSPDGTKIAYSFVFHDSSTHIDLANADGSGSTCCLTGEHPPFNSARDSEATWSPDSGLIAYYGNAALQSPGIWLINADGTNARQLTVGADHNPSISPDGTRVAFSRGGTIWSMKVIPGFEGTDQDDSHVAGGDPSWGP
jgi:Tol biopolymer transport system component